MSPARIIGKVSDHPAPPNEKQCENAAIIESQDLFGESREVSIRHNGTVYRLKITRFDKLILNK